MLVDDRMHNLAKLLDVADLRARIHAQNIANQNTPGYTARAVRFEDAFRTAMDQEGDAAARGVQPEVYKPRSTPVDNDGNDVSVDREVTQMAQNAALYNAYLQILRGKYSLMGTAVRGEGA